MRALTDAEVTDWCTAQGISLCGPRLRFSGGPETSLLLPMPREPHRVPWFGIDLLDVDVEQPAEYVLWVRECGIWSDFITEIGVGHFERLRQSYGIGQTLEARPATLMDINEVQAIAALSMFPVLFGWDAYLIAGGRDYFTFISNDESACIIPRDMKSQDSAMIRLKKWGAEAGPRPRWA
jgi:hypothetical protein